MHREHYIMFDQHQYENRENTRKDKFTNQFAGTNHGTQNEKRNQSFVAPRDYCRA
jgi:hypothetical protein